MFVGCVAVPGPLHHGKGPYLPLFTTIITPLLPWINVAGIPGVWGVFLVKIGCNNRGIIVVAILHLILCIHLSMEFQSQGCTLLYHSIDLSMATVL
jgi:hypothetical protein